MSEPAQTPLNPLVLYVRLTEASADLARQIQLLDMNDPGHALSLEAAWVRLDDLIEQLPAALAHEPVSIEEHA